MYKDVVRLVYTIEITDGKETFVKTFANCTSVALFEKVFEQFKDAWEGFKVTYTFVGLNYTREYVG